MTTEKDGQILARDFVKGMVPGAGLRRRSDGRLFAKSKVDEMYHLTEWSFFDVTGGTVVHGSEIIEYSATLDELVEQFEIVSFS